MEGHSSSVSPVDANGFMGNCFMGVVLTARRLLGRCPTSVREKHREHVYKLSAVFAWCVTAAKKLVLADPHFACRGNATFVLVVNRSKLSDPLVSISATFLLDERDAYIDQAVAETNLLTCKRPSDPSGERLMRFRFEVEDRCNHDCNPNAYMLISLDEAEFWQHISLSSRTDVEAAVQECGDPVVSDHPEYEGARIFSPWGGVPSPLLLELMRSAYGVCICCLTPTNKRCSRCGRALYCSPECQVQDYKSSHKALCATGVPEAAAHAFGVLCVAAQEILALPWTQRRRDEADPDSEYDYLEMGRVVG